VIRTRIMVINPNTTASMTVTVTEAASTVVRPGTALIPSTATSGPATVESNLEEALGAVAVADQVQAGEAAGIDGYVVACFGDTGVAAAREMASGPVVGMTEAALVTAAMLARYFAVVTLPSRTRHQSERVVRELGLDHRCRIRAVDVGVTEIATGAAPFLDAIEAEAHLAIDHDHAEAIILGCAGLAELTAPLTSSLGVPVVEGVAAAVAMVDGLLAQRLSTSRLSTYAPAE
jgi:allantoin racemase